VTPVDMSKRVRAYLLMGKRVSNGVADVHFEDEVAHVIFGVGRMVIIGRKDFSVSVSQGVTDTEALWALKTVIEVDWDPFYNEEDYSIRYDFDGNARTLTELRQWLKREGLTSVRKDALCLSGNRGIYIGKPRLEKLYREDSGESTGVHTIYSVRMDSHMKVKGDTLMERVALFAHIFGRNIK